MNLQQKIGQMILTGFRGIDVDERSSVVKDIRQGNIGGVILFDKDVALNSNERNIKSPEQVKKLNEHLLEYAKGDLLISIDQEGGLITRLKEEYGFGKTASHQQIGERNDRDYTVSQAREMSETLKEAGFNLNFAPVVDLNINPENPVIGNFERSFSDDADIVFRHASIFVDEMRKKGIVSALKHFPGHGSSTADSHEGFVDVTKIWELKELSPFRDLIKADKADVIMTAHIFNSNYDRKYPATLSENWLKGILRYGLHYDGVIITDDMQMKAISRHFTLVESVELALNAGADILMFANNVDFDEDIASKVVDIILELVKTNRISEERIEESFLRIKKLKNKIFK